MARASITRRTCLAGLAALPLAARAENFAQGYVLHPELVAEGIWILRGADEGIAFANGGAIANAAILKSDHGAILFDCGPSLAFGQALAKTAQSLTGGPVQRVFISHLHPDHAMGAAAFAPDIVAALPETTREIARDGAGFSDAMYRMLSDWMRGTNVVLPALAATPGPVTIDGRQLELYALAGHSAADLVIRDVATQTLITGDLVFNNRAPATPDANLAIWQQSLDNLAQILHKALIPGHGPLDRANTAIAQTRDWLNWLAGALDQAVAQGLDMFEAGEIAIPDRFAGVKMARYELQRSVSHFYAALEAQHLPRIEP